MPPAGKPEGVFCFGRPDLEGEVELGNHRIHPQGRKGETPNPKHQAPDKSQAQNPNSARDVAALELVIWNFWTGIQGAAELAPPAEFLPPRNRMLRFDRPF